MNFLRRLANQTNTSQPSRERDEPPRAVTTSEGEESDRCRSSETTSAVPRTLRATFDENKDAELIFLWSVAAGAGDVDGRRDALGAFFEAFAESYVDWQPEPGDAGTDEDVGCSRAHPGDVLLAALEACTQLPPCLERALAGSLDAGARDMRLKLLSVETFRALELMAKSPFNRAFLEQSGASRALGVACKSCAQRLLAMSNVVSSAPDALRSETVVLLNALQRVVKSIIMIIDSFADDMWALHPLNENGALLGALEILRVEKIVAARLVDDSRLIAIDVECVAAAVVGRVMERDVVVEQSLTSAGGLDIFFEGIYPLNVELDAGLFASCLMSLDMARNFLKGSKANIERAASIGMFERLAQLIQRASGLSCNLVGLDEPSMSEEGALDSLLLEHPVPACDECLGEVFRRLTQIVEKDRQDDEAWVTRGVHEALLASVLGSVVAACSVAQNVSDTSVLCLYTRSHVIEFLSRTLDADPGIILTLRKLRTWDVLLDRETLGEIPSMDPDAVIGNEDASSRILRRRVQIRTAALLLKACRTASLSSECDVECNALIGVITTRAMQPSVVTVFCRVLELLLTGSSHVVSKALAEIEAPSRLAGAVSAQMTCWGNDVLAKDAAIPKAVALRSTLSALNACLNGPDSLAVSALNNDGVPDLILNELLWSPSTRDFAISAIISLVGLRLHVPAPHTSSAQREAWANVARRFIQALPRARSSDAGLLKAMMSGLRQMLSNPNGSGTSLRDWISSQDGAELVQIVALCDGVAGEDIALDVIATVRVFISNSYSAGAMFEAAVGYDTFTEAIQCARGTNKFSKKLFDALMDFVIDGDYSQHRDLNGSALRNAKALGILLFLFARLETGHELKDELLVAFHTMLSSSVTSKATAEAAGVTDFLLQLFETDKDRRQAVLELIGLCSSFSMSTKNVRKMFELLQGDTITAQDKLQLLRVLQTSAKRDGPSTFFDFTGPGCGVHVNKSLILPARNGYSISIWFRVERFPDSGAPIPLFSMLSGSGNGVMGELRTNRITLGIRGNSGVIETASIDVTVPVGEWTFLTVVHAPIRMSQHVVKLFIGDDMISQTKLPYPIKGAEAIAHSRIASVTFDASLEDARVNVSPFFGQLGSTHIFDDALSQPAIAMIHALGAEYAGRFKSTESQTERILAATSMHAVEARDTRDYLAEHRAISVSAITMAGRLAQSGEAHGNSEYDLIGGAKVCVTKAVKDVVHCLGGVQVVLPLFSDIVRHVNESLCPQIVCEGIYFLVALLDGNRLNQVTLNSIDGYALIANLLRKNARTFLSQDLLQALDRLRRASGLENESASARLVLDLHLWSLADEATQKAHGDYLVSLASQHAEGLRYHLSTSDLIDALELSPGENGTSRRRVLLDVLKLLVVGAPAHVLDETTDTIVSVIEDCADEDVVGDVLRWLVNSMQPGEALQAALYHSFTRLGGPLLVLSPLSRNSRRVRSSALLWLATLMPPLEPSSKNASSSHISAAFGAAAGALTATLGGRLTAAASQDFEVGFFTTVAKTLERFPLDISESRTALFELLLGGQALPAEKVAEKLNMERNSSIRAAAGRLFSKVTRAHNEAQKERESSALGVPGIVNAGAAGVLLRLMSVCSDPEMRLSVLELLLQLVEGASINAQAVLEQRGWQTWILPILHEDGDVSRTEERSMGFRLITALLAHAVLRTEEGHQHVSNTLGVIDILIKRGVLADDSDLALELLSDLLLQLIPQRVGTSIEHDEWSEVENVESPICRRNLAKLLHIFDSIISDTAKTLAMLGVPSKSEDRLSIKHVSWRFYGSLWNLLDIISPPGQALENAEEIKDCVKNTNIAQKLHRRARSMIKDLPFSNHREEDFESVQSVETLRENCQGMGFRLALLYVRAGSLEDLHSVMNTFIGLIPSFLSPVIVDNDAKPLDTTLLANRAHLFVGDLIRFVESAKSSHDDDASERVSVVSNLIRLTCEVGRFLLSESSSAEECAHLDGRDLISEQKVAAAAANEVKQARKVKELRAKVSENFLSERTRDEQRQASAEAALLDTHKSKVTPVSERERARRAMQRLTFDERCNMIDRRWLTILHDLQGERGAWALAETDAEVHWKMDKSEDAAMRRPRLRKDYKFKQYVDNQKGGESAQNAEVEDIQKIRLVGMGMRWSNLASDKELNEADDIADEIAEKIALDKEDAMHNRSKVIFSTSAMLVTLARTVPGKLNISRDAIVFAADRAHENSKDHRKHFWRWSLSDVVQVYHMRYRLQHTAFEMHCSDRSSAFFAFESKKASRYAAARVAASAGAVLMNRHAKAEAAERAKELWRRRKLSTFDYLMALNVFAGRTLHDLSQYPVFPWVLKEYEAETLDLSNPAIYRDLSKPVGALNEDRLKSFIERYNSLLNDPDTPPFYYGSHYSSSPIVLYYLLRLEPYTKLARALQGDRFDRADRLFHSIAETFKGCTESTADVKELIPEFYYSSEFLVNGNRLKLGTRQDGAIIDDVVLPPWANGSRHEFTRVMREALESEYVSQNLHHWIDLIFGHAQRGQVAVEHFNVFYYLTYEGAVDLSTLEDEDQRKAVETQIINFGQTPSQIFKRPHIERLGCPSNEFMVSRSPESLSLVTMVSPPTEGYSFLSASAVVRISVYESRITTVSSARVLLVHKLRMPGMNFTTGTVDDSVTYALEPDSTLSSRTEEVDDFRADSVAHSQTVNVAVRGRLLLSVGHWDRSMRLFDIDEGRELQRVSAHRDVTTCLALCERGSSRSWDDGSSQQTRQLLIVTGSRDTTVAVWQIEAPQGGWGISKASRAIKAEPKIICFGHDEAITCIDVSSPLNLVVSGSVDGTLILHDIRDGHIVRALESTPHGCIPTSVALLSKSSLVVCACSASGTLSVHSINGATLARTMNRHESFDSFCVTRDERHILLGNRRGDITVRASHDLSIRAQMNVANVGITSIETAGKDECLLVGLADGRLCLWAPPSST